MAGRLTRGDRLALAGLAGCGAALVLAAVLPPTAWRAWLAAAFVCGAAPIGAMALLMTMRLIPGDWAQELGPFMEAGVLLLPLCAALLVPVLVEVGAIYPWTAEQAPTAFKAAWLSPLFFAVRTILWFALLIGLAFLLVVRGVTAPAVPSLGVVLFPTLGTFVAFDWVLSLDPKFASSGFGLYVICIQALSAMALALAALVASGLTIRRPGILGGVLLSLLLLWVYFAFMHYLIVWSENLPAGVRWYQRRSGGWGLVMWVIAATRLAPAFLLFFRAVRKNPPRLLVLSLVVLGGTVLEAAWLILPADGAGRSATPLDGALYGLALVAMTALMAGLAPRALAWRDARRAS